MYRDTLLHFFFDMEGHMLDSIVKLPGQWLGEPSVLAPNAAYAFYQDRFYHSRKRRGNQGIPFVGRAE